MTGDNPLFRRSDRKRQAENPYQRFDLTQNPFPDSPTIVPGSDDPRQNGEIYHADLRAEEEAQFERLLIPHPERPEPRLIAFLMDFATRRGRGIGKTAFLNHQRRRIMSDLGAVLTGGEYVLLASHMIPAGGGRTRKFWQFVRLIAKSLNEGQCIAWAVWRLRASSKQIPEGVLNDVDPNSPGPTLGNDSWLRAQGIDALFTLNPAVERMLIQTGIREDVAHSLAYYGHNPEQWDQNFLSQQSDYRWRRDGYTLVFDDLVRLFQTAGIDKVLLLVDEVEKIVVPQNRQERRAFVDDLRRSFVDGPFQNVYDRFFELLLTIHPYIQELWTPHWKAAGLDRTSSISGSTAQEHTIYFRPLQAEEMSIPLTLAYMDYFRTSSEQRGQLRPFDEEAVIEALQLSGGVPGPMLKILRLALERAMREEWDTVRADQVKAIYEDVSPMEPEGESITEELSPPQVHLDE